MFLCSIQTYIITNVSCTVPVYYILYNESQQNNKWNFDNQILVFAAGVSTNKLGSVEHSHDLDHDHDEHSHDVEAAQDQEERQGRSQYLGQLEQGEVHIL